MSDIISILAIVIILALVGLTLAVVIDRGRMGWGRAAAEATARRRQYEDMAERIQHMERVIEEQKTDLVNKEGKAGELGREIEKIKTDLDSRELPFRYTTVPIASGDMYGPTWRFVARQPALAEGAAPDHPAAQWDAGRTYIVATVNQSEARSVMDRLLPRHRGFNIVAVGAIVSNAPSAN
ncbi:MAG: hypothetical protein ACK4FK_12570 [Ferrovibrio sp.]|jgi:hypothetical protein|uniref:hypothetical protein n=1 Tax=Ferrovibrio sp. TaxID=1917215 RepID=UPI00391D3328